jgi:hypothetical protein
MDADTDLALLKFSFGIEKVESSVILASKERTQVRATNPGGDCSIHQFLD